MLPLLIITSLQLYFPNMSKNYSNLIEMKMFGLRILDLASHLINFLSHFKKDRKQYVKNYLVEANGVEPMTLCVQGRCSSQLSYAPDIIIIKHSTINNQR